MERPSTSSATGRAARLLTVTAALFIIASCGDIGVTVGYDAALYPVTYRVIDQYGEPISGIPFEIEYVDFFDDNEVACQGPDEDAKLYTDPLGLATARRYVGCDLRLDSIWPDEVLYSNYRNLGDIVGQHPEEFLVEDAPLAVTRTISMFRAKPPIVENRDGNAYIRLQDFNLPYPGTASVRITPDYASESIYCSYAAAGAETDFYAPSGVLLDPDCYRLEPGFSTGLGISLYPVVNGDGSLGHRDFGTLRCDESGCWAEPP